MFQVRPTKLEVLVCQGQHPSLFSFFRRLALMLIVTAATVKAGTPPDPSNGTYSCVWVSTAVAPVSTSPSLNTSSESTETNATETVSVSTTTAATSFTTTLQSGNDANESSSSDSNDTTVAVPTTTAAASTSTAGSGASSTTTTQSVASTSNDTNTDSNTTVRRLRGTAFLQVIDPDETEVGTVDMRASAPAFLSSQLPQVIDLDETKGEVRRQLSHSGYWNCTSRANVSSNHTANITNASNVSTNSSAAINTTKVATTSNASNASGINTTNKSAGAFTPGAQCTEEYKECAEAVQCFDHVSGACGEDGKLVGDCAEVLPCAPCFPNSRCGGESQAKDSSTSGSGKIFIVVTMTIKNVDYEKLSKDDKDELKGKVRENLAKNADVDEATVFVELSAGSIKVEASIQASDMSSVESISKKMESVGADEFAKQILEIAKSIPGVKEAATGELEVTADSFEVVTKKEEEKKEEKDDKEKEEKDKKDEGEETEGGGAAPSPPADGGEEDDSVLLGLNAMMLGIIGGSVGGCCAIAGGAAAYVKKKRGSEGIAPGDAMLDENGKPMSKIAQLNAKAKAYKENRKGLNAKAKDAKNAKLEGIKDKAKGYKVENLDVAYDNTKEGERATWKDIIAACNEANPDNKLEKNDRIVGVEAEGASVLEDGVKVVLEVQEDLTVAHGKDGKAEDVESVLEKLKEKKSFQLKVERDKKSEEMPDANGETNGEANGATELETDDEAKERLSGKAAKLGCLAGLKAKKEAKVTAMKEKKAAKQAAKDAGKTEANGEETKPAEGDAKEEAKPAEEAKKAEEKPAEDAKPAEEAKTAEEKPAEEAPAE